MRLGRARLWVACLLFLSGCVGSGYRWSAPGENTSFPSAALLDRPAGVAGTVPARVVLQSLLASGVVAESPEEPLPQKAVVVVDQGETQGDVARELGVACGLEYDATLRLLLPRVASHVADGPDAIGRTKTDNPAWRKRRRQYLVRVAFVHGTAAIGAGTDALTLAGDVVEFERSVPEGVSDTFSSTTEQSYTAAIQSTISNNAVPTTQITVSAGVQWSGLVGYLGAGLMRLGGVLSVSSFTSPLSTDRAVVTVPIELDGPAGRWLEVCSLNDADVGVRVALRDLGFHTALGGDAVRVYVRVD